MHSINNSIFACQHFQAADSSGRWMTCHGGSGLVPFYFKHHDDDDLKPSSVPFLSFMGAVQAKLM